MKKIFYLILILFTSTGLFGQEHVFVETESFENTGGWVIDQQSFDVMGSSYLLAHGMGKPVKDATTTVNFEKPGKYHLWVRTKDWAPFPTGPGKFLPRRDCPSASAVFCETPSALSDYAAVQISSRW